MNKLDHLVVNLEKLKNKDGNKAATLSNVYDTLLEFLNYPKISEQSYARLRKIIIMHLKELNNKEIDEQEMFVRIFNDLRT